MTQQIVFPNCELVVSKNIPSGNSYQTKLSENGVELLKTTTGDGSYYASYNNDGITFINATGTSKSLNISVDNISTNGTLNVVGQTDFDTPPHSTTPINGNDLATKGYVDSLVGQYSGGYNLFFNYSVSVGVYKSLGQTIVDTTQQSTTLTTDGTLQEIAKFVSDALGLTSIPSGIWNVLLYGKVDNINNVINYSFKLYKYNGTTETLIVSSGNSDDVNTITNPTAYSINATLASSTAIALTDKIVIKLYAQASSSTPAIQLTTYFQNTYYSFTQSTLNAGTTLLSSDNTWTGTNAFTQSPTAPTATAGDSTTKLATTAFVQGASSNLLSSNNTWEGTNAFSQTITASTIDSATSLSLGVTNATSIGIGKAGVNTTISGTAVINTIESSTVSSTGNLWTNLTTGTSNLMTGLTTGTVNLLTGASRSGSLNIHTGSAVANTINVGNNLTTTTFNGLLYSPNLDQIGALTIGGTSATSIGIGKAGVNTTISGTAIINNMLTSAVNSSANLWTTLTTGSANIMTGLTTGTVNLLTGASRSGTLNIHTGSGVANTINVGNNLTTTTFNGLLYSPNLDQIGTLTLGGTSATSIGIGKAGINTTISGTAVINTIESSAVSSTANLWTNLTTGTANLMTSLTNGTVNLLTGASRSGALNIQTGSGVANTISIGNSFTTTTINGSLNSPNVVMGLNNWITYNSGNTYTGGGGNGVANSIGYQINQGSPNGTGFVNNNDLTTATPQQYGTLSLPQGTYSISGTLAVTSASQSTIQSFVVTLNGGTFTTSGIIPALFAGTFYMNISGVLTQTATTSTSLSLTPTFTGTAPKMTNTGFRFTAVRIG